MASSAPTFSFSRLTRRALTISSAGLGALAFFWMVYLGLTWDLRGADASVDAGYASVLVERGRLTQTVAATGVMEPFARVVVQSEVPGIVEAVHVDAGDRVTRGQLLVALDRERLEDRAAELRAALRLESALARIDLIGRASAELENASREHARTRELHQRGVATAKQLDDAAYRLRLGEIAVGDARAELDARRAAADRARRALVSVERDLAKSAIRAPVDGVVVRRNVEVGAAVADLQNGATVVALLADDSRIHLLGDVDENDIAAVREGQPAEVRIDAFSAEVFAGRVRKVSASGTSQGSISSFEVEIEVDPDARIRVGMSADARIAVREHADVLLIPNEAILRSDDGPSVRRLRPDEPGEFDLVRIREGYSDGFMTVVAAGLAEGDRLKVRDRGLP